MQINELILKLQNIAKKNPEIEVVVSVEDIGFLEKEIETRLIYRDSYGTRNYDNKGELVLEIH